MCDHAGPLLTVSNRVFAACRGLAAAWAPVPTLGDAQWTKERSLDRAYRKWSASSVLPQVRSVRGPFDYVRPGPVRRQPPIMSDSQYVNPVVCEQRGQVVGIARDRRSPNVEGFRHSLDPRPSYQRAASASSDEASGPKWTAGLTPSDDQRRDPAPWPSRQSPLPPKAPAPPVVRAPMPRLHQRSRGPLPLANRGWPAGERRGRHDPRFVAPEPLGGSSRSQRSRPDSTSVGPRSAPRPCSEGWPSRLRIVRAVWRPVAEITVRLGAQLGGDVVVAVERRLVWRKPSVGRPLMSNGGAPSLPFGPGPRPSGQHRHLLGAGHRERAVS